MESVSSVSDEASCLNLFVNRLDSVCQQYHYVEFETKNHFHCQLDGSDNKKKQDFSGGVALGCVLQLGMLSFVLTSDSRPEAAETQWQELEHSVSGVVKRGYNPLKIHSKGSRFPFLHPTPLKVFCYKNVALVHDAVPSWSEAKSSLQQVGLDLGIEGRVRWRFWMLRDERSRVQKQRGWMFGSPWWRNGWRGVGEKRYSQIDET